MTDQPRTASGSAAWPGPDEMLIDPYLPECDVALIEHLVVDADPTSSGGPARYPRGLRS